MSVLVLYQTTYNLLKLYSLYKTLSSGYNDYQKMRFIYEHALYFVIKAKRVIRNLDKTKHKEKIKNCEIAIKNFEDNPLNNDDDSWVVINRQDVIKDIDQHALTGLGFFYKV